MASDRIAGVDHVSLPMEHTEEMVRFYRALGFEVDEQKAVVAMRAGGQMINFHRPEIWRRDGFTLRAPKAVPPCGDLCFVWEGGADALHALLAQAGAGIEEGPVERIGGRRQTATSVYVRDPDGNLLEFLSYQTTARPAGVESSVESTSRQETTAQRPEGAEREVDQ